MAEGIARISEVFTAAALVVAVLIVPYCFVALHAWENNRKVRYVRRNQSARFWPSLFITTWITRVNGAGVTYIMATFLLRAYLQYEEIGETAPQPAWSYILSMFGTMFFLVILMMPATFLLWVKREIKEAPYEEEKDVFTKP